MTVRIVGAGMVGIGLCIGGLLASSPITPQAWVPPPASGEGCENAPLVGARVLADGLPGKPDGLAFDANGRLLAALANGDVVAIDTATGRWSEEASGGSFLTGVTIKDDGLILAVDERAGALLAARKGEKFRMLIDRVGRTRLSWTNDVAVAPDGIIYLTTTATGRSLDDFYLEVLEHKGSGLIIRYDPQAKEARVLASGLQMANGIAVTPDGSLLVAESATYGLGLFGRNGNRIASLQGLPGFTGNIRASDTTGRYWLTLLSPRSSLIDGLAPYPWARRLLAWLPSSMRPGPAALSCVVQIRLDDGRLSATSLRVSGVPSSFSTAIERGGKLYLSPASIVSGSSARIYVADLSQS